MSERSGALLCERCGYHLRGLAREDNCPECGYPILQSLYSTRSGTRWQRERTWRALWATTREMIRHPRTFWDQVQFHKGSPSPILLNYLACMLLICVLPSTTLVLTTVFIPSRDGFTASVIYSLIYSIIAFSVIHIAMWIEILGCRMIVKLHRWRIPGAAIRMVVHQALIGWALWGVMLELVYLDLVVFYSRNHSLLFWLFGGRGPGWSTTVYPILILLSTLVGLISFETLVYFGLRRLKYANPPRAEEELSEPTTEPSGDPDGGSRPEPGGEAGRGQGGDGVPEVAKRR